MLLELRVQRLVGTRLGGELLGVADDQALEIAILGGIVGMSGETVDLGVRETYPLTEGDVQGDSILTAVELGRPQVGELP